MSPEEWLQRVERELLDPLTRELWYVTERLQGEEVARDVLLEQVAVLKAIIDAQRDELAALKELVQCPPKYRSR